MVRTNSKACLKSFGMQLLVAEVVIGVEELLIFFLLIQLSKPFACEFTNVVKHHTIMTYQRHIRALCVSGQEQFIIYTVQYGILNE